jgi:molybdenum cofactor guanylyltransferase
MTTLAILAGGESRRMGRPKAELRVAGKPILEYLLDRFAWPGPTLLVTAPGRERPAGAARFGREVADPVAGEGPLRGVVTALEAATTEIVLITTCDMPGLEGRHLEWLRVALLERPDAPLVMTKRASGVEPFPLAIRRDALALVRDRFAHGGRSVQSLSTLPGAVLVDAPADWGAEAWINLNTSDDVARFLD